MSVIPGRLPKCFVFDLDYTLWNLWVDTHVTPPLARRGEDVNKIYDKYGETLEFYWDVPQILLDLKASGVHVAAASRTSAPKAARQALTELMIPSSKNGPLISAITLFDTLEIYPGSKLTHFKKLADKTGIPSSECVFYDDEKRNREVTKLGVTFVLAERGLTRKLLEEGIESWRQNNKIPQSEEEV